MVNDKILIARENRRKKIIELAKKHNVVTLKANIPGENKSLLEAYLTVNYFINKVVGFGASFVELENSEDGVTVYFTVSDGEEFKKKAQELEENNPLGRLVDIDVTPFGSERSLVRQRMRKCFLCDEYAFVCGRNKTHKVAELIRFFKDKSEEFFILLIESVISESMFSELNLENKFGLVTPTSNGSHNDLSYNVMAKAIEEIKTPLTKAFFIGLRADRLDNLTNKLISVGLECEEKMLSVTSGANAYKGFIFVGGVLLTALGYTLKNNGNDDDIYNNAKIICSNFTFPFDTFGAKAYNLGFGGIRKEGIEGFSTVKVAEKKLDKDSLSDVLKYIVGTLDDSVLYKRAKSIEKYNYFKKLISSSKGEEKNVTKECIDNNISIGGSADVLIASIMMKKFKEIFYFKV